MTLSITILSIKTLFATLSITKRNHYAECRYVECRILFLAVLNVIMLNVIMLSVTKPSQPNVLFCQWCPTEGATLFEVQAYASRLCNSKTHNYRYLQ
jgi:hypothetical protein